MITACVGLGLRRYAPGMVLLSTGHVLVVAWTAWYVVEAAWASSPISASRTPVPAMVFELAWRAGTALVVLSAPLVGAAMLAWMRRGPASLPVGSAPYFVAAWMTSVLGLGIVAVAPLPVYVALRALGAVSSHTIVAHTLWQGVLIVVAPLPGLLLPPILWGRRRR